MLPILNPIDSDRFVTVQYEGPLTSSEKNVFRSCDPTEVANWVTASVDYDEVTDVYMSRWDAYLSMIRYVADTGLAITIHIEEGEEVFIQKGFHGEIPGLDADKMEFRLDEDWIGARLDIANWIPLVKFN